MGDRLGSPGGDRSGVCFEVARYSSPAKSIAMVQAEGQRGAIGLPNASMRLFRLELL